MTDIVVVEYIGITIILVVITLYCFRIYLRAKRPAKPYPGTESA